MLVPIDPCSWDATEEPLVSWNTRIIIKSAPCHSIPVNGYLFQIADDGSEQTAVFGQRVLRLLSVHSVSKVGSAQEFNGLAEKTAFSEKIFG